MKKLVIVMALAVAISACDPYNYGAQTSIELKKDPCFGLCPVYTFKVDGKGNAVFNGVRNIEKIGGWTRKLSPAESNRLFHQIDSIKIHQFEDEYNSAQVVDLPTTWLTYADGQQTKTIKDRYGAPEALKNLERMLETLAEQNEGWTKAKNMDSQPEK